MGWGVVMEAAQILQILLCCPNKPSIFSEKNKPFCPMGVFFPLVVFAKDTWGGVVELGESLLIHKRLSAQQEKPCVSKTIVCYQNAAVSRPPNKDGPFKLNKFLSRQPRRIAQAIIPAPQKFKSPCFYSISVLFFFLLFFWWRKKSRRWKAYLMFIAVLRWRAFRVPRQY